MKQYIKIGLLTLGLGGLTSCLGDLDRAPFIEVTSASVYQDPANYKKVLAKLYAGLAVTGQEGPAGLPDIGGIDEGFSAYLRQYWQAQQLTTDETVIGWNDGSLPDYHDMDWTSSNEFIMGLYSRIFYQVTICNEFIRETSPEKLASRNISGSEYATYRAEARFLRALSYFHALDMFGSVPFVTEADAPGSFLPRQTNRAELFAYIESELKAIENDMPSPRQNEFGRADRAAVWMLMAKLYLNAEVFIGQPKYSETIDATKKIIAAGYSLHPTYRGLFLADNHKSSEIIFPIRFDGMNTRSWGGMTYLVHAPVGGSMNPAEFGINGGWAGLRTTPSLVQKFPAPNGPDARAMFHTQGQNLNISDIFTFTDGFAVTKYRNVDSNGRPGSDASGDHPDTDFPMFRLADAYLMYAEAVLRGGAGGDRNTAIGYINQLRQRAYGNTSGNVTDINLNFILDERSRELYWEGHRRTDLIRFNRFTGTEYVWQWKGGVQPGRGVEAFRNVFPLPAADLVANPNLKQNPGY